MDELEISIEEINNNLPNNICYGEEYNGHESIDSSDDDDELRYSSYIKDTDEKINQVYQRIINGEYVELDDVLSYTSYDKLFEKLKIHENDANCMYHAGCCLVEGSEEGKAYFEKAARLGHNKSSFVLAHQKFITNKEESLEDGVTCLLNGFKYPHPNPDSLFFKNMPPIMDNEPPTGLQYYCFVLERYIEKLKKQIEQKE